MRPHAPHRLPRQAFGGRQKLALIRGGDLSWKRVKLFLGRRVFFENQQPDGRFWSKMPVEPHKCWIYRRGE